jgi:hypothetical protein
MYSRLLDVLTHIMPKRGLAGAFADLCFPLVAVATDAEDKVESPEEPDKESPEDDVFASSPQPWKTRIDRIETETRTSFETRIISPRDIFSLLSRLIKRT